MYHTSDDNFYTILELQQQASHSQVKKAFFEKSKKLHPDKNPTEEAKQNYEDVREAYDVLGDREKRIAYDRLLQRQSFRESVRPNEHSTWSQSQSFQERVRHNEASHWSHFHGKD